MSTIRTARPRTRASLLVLALAALLGLGALLGLTTSAQSAPQSRAPAPGAKPTIVLVHGAWADASGWNRVIVRLQKKGYTVVAPANPLRSLKGDSEYLASFLAQTPGPLVVVGHSYGGAVITNAAAGNPNVKALVYINGFVPDIGEDILHLGGADSQVPSAIQFKGFPPFGPADADIYIDPAKFHEVFANDLSQQQASVLAATQRPIAVPAASEPTFATAWKDVPSWYLLGTEDHTVTPDAQRFMAERAHSHIVEIKASHLSMVSHPAAAAKLIEQAAAATG